MNGKKEVLYCATNSHAMTQERINQYKSAASLGIIPDDENPIFLFNQTHADILIGIINGEIDAIQFARIEMRNRGLDVKTGKWVGWKTNEDSYQVA